MLGDIIDLLHGEHQASPSCLARPAQGSHGWRLSFPFLGRDLVETPFVDSRGFGHRSAGCFARGWPYDLRGTAMVHDLSKESQPGLGWPGQIEPTITP